MDKRKENSYSNDQKGCKRVAKSRSCFFCWHSIIYIWLCQCVRSVHLVHMRSETFKTDYIWLQVLFFHFILNIHCNFNMPCNYNNISNSNSHKIFYNIFQIEQRKMIFSNNSNGSNCWKTKIMFCLKKMLV
jgi:hypothetical protein